jgi:hypothetical protein
MRRNLDIPGDHTPFVPVIVLVEVITTDSVRRIRDDQVN